MWAPYFWVEPFILGGVLTLLQMIAGSSKCSDLTTKVSKASPKKIIRNLHILLQVGRNVAKWVRKKRVLYLNLSTDVLSRCPTVPNDPSQIREGIADFKVPRRPLIFFGKGLILGADSFVVGGTVDG